MPLPDGAITGFSVGHAILLNHHLLLGDGVQKKVSECQCHKPVLPLRILPLQELSHKQKEAWESGLPASVVQQSEGGIEGECCSQLTVEHTCYHSLLCCNVGLRTDVIP